MLGDAWRGASAPATADHVEQMRMRPGCLCAWCQQQAQALEQHVALVCP